MNFNLGKDEKDILKKSLRKSLAELDLALNAMPEFQEYRRIQALLEKLDERHISEVKKVTHELNMMDTLLSGLSEFDPKWSSRKQSEFILNQAYEKEGKRGLTNAEVVEKILQLNPAADRKALIRNLSVVFSTLVPKNKVFGRYKNTYNENVYTLLSWGAETKNGKVNEEIVQ